MSRFIDRGVCALAILAVLPWSFGRAASYNEFVDGDLSPNVQAPTLLVLDAGSNVLVAAASVSDVDLLRIRVPASQVLESLVVEFHEDPNRVFGGIEQGGSWTAGVGSEIDPSMMLGWVDFPTDPGHAHVGEDILDDMGLAAGSIGFTAPLPSGDYTFLFQTSSSAIQFALSFNVSASAAGVPGDFNGDQTVDGRDLATWRGAFGVAAGGDGDSDGDSDGADLLVWQRHIDPPAVAAAAVVPEPAALVLAATACAWVLRRRAVEEASHVS